MRFGTWNVRNLHRSGSHTAAGRELARYKLDLVGVQEVRWDKRGTVRAGDYNYNFIKNGCDGFSAYPTYDTFLFKHTNTSPLLLLVIK